MSPSDATTRRRGTFLAEVLANDRLCAEHGLLRLGVANFPPTRPGQFVQVQCCPPDKPDRPHAVDWPDDRPPQLTQPDLVRAEALLRRPFSLAGRRDLGAGRSELRVIYRVVGSGTGWLEQTSPGEPVSVLGPLGNAFAIREAKPAAALVGGGVGIPPMIYLAEALARAGKDTTAFCGVRARDLLPLTLTGDVAVSSAGEPSLCVAEFAACGIATALASDDGSLGLEGFAPEAFERWLGARGGSPEELVVYSCGPEAMMRAVGEACVARGIDCQLALERHMGCGMGTCQSCVVRIRADNEAGWTYKLVCTDGPVFDARDVLWD